MCVRAAIRHRYDRSNNQQQRRRRSLVLVRKLAARPLARPPAALYLGAVPESMRAPIIANLQQPAMSRLISSSSLITTGTVARGRVYGVGIIIMNVSKLSCCPRRRRRKTTMPPDPDYAQPARNRINNRYMNGRSSHTRVSYSPISARRANRDTVCWQQKFPFRGTRYAKIATSAAAAAASAASS